jgi:uncharacterized RDD family membrane protein YckC
MNPTRRRPGRLRPAGLISRFCAIAIDALIAWLSFAVAVGGGLALSSFVRLGLPGWLQGWRWPAAWLCWVVLVAVYQVGCWRLFGHTPGKALLGLEVVRTRGAPGGRATVGVPRGLLRLLGYLVSALPLFAGFLWVLVDNHRRAWHDHIAGTSVVYRPGRRPA